uniref:Uncharacterized protein n=1 Tax=viral metagenome TaxID=1070528 RepID=A0A6M3JX35_9ZZZZ
MSSFEIESTLTQDKTIEPSLPEAAGSAVTWTSPTSYSDPESAWINEANAYDGSTDTYASMSDWIPASDWGDYLYLIHAAILTNAIKFKAGQTFGDTIIDIDLYYGSAWHDLYQDDTTHATLIEVNIEEPTAVSVTQARIRFYSDDATAKGHIFELAFGLGGYRVEIESTLGIGD